MKLSQALQMHLFARQLLANGNRAQRRYARRLLLRAFDAMLADLDRRHLWDAADWRAYHLLRFMDWHGI